MPQHDYKAYAASEKGKAARAKARAKYLAKRKQAPAPGYVFDLTRIIQNWSRS
jgi:hypothetical protein